MRKILALVVVLGAPFVWASGYFGGSGSAAPSGPAGGDLAGIYPTPTLAVDRVRKVGDTMSGGLGLSYSDVTPDRVSFVDGARVIRTSSSVSSQELEYLDGLTANVQARIDSNSSSIAALQGVTATQAAQISALQGVTNSFVLRAGDTMTGDLILQGGASDLQFRNNVANIYWQLSANNLASGTFSLTPSTTGGGTTFTTAILNVSTSQASLTVPLTLSGATATVTGPGDGLNLKLYTSDNVLNAKASMTFGTTPGDRAKARISMVNQTTGNAKGDLIFETNDGTSLSEALKIDGDGVITVSEVLTLPDGSALSPGVRFTSDADTGIYRPSANNLSIATSGVQVVNVSTAGTTVSSTLSATNTGTSISASGSISAAQDLFVGQSGSGTGGKLRIRCDSGSECWRLGPGGGAGETDFNVRSIPLSAVVISVSTAGQISLPLAGTRISMEQNGGNTGIQTITLSGVSTFIDNTTVTANSYPFFTSVGAANVSPWLIGLTTGVGYSVGATGAGTAKVVILEGQ